MTSVAALKIADAYRLAVLLIPALSLIDVQSNCVKILLRVGSSQFRHVDERSGEKHFRADSFGRTRPTVFLSHPAISRPLVLGAEWM
jgi:hypothetical protein